MLFRAGNAQCHQTFCGSAMLAMSVETGIVDSPGVSVAKQTRINHPTNNE